MRVMRAVLVVLLMLGCRTHGPAGPASTASGSASTIEPAPRSKTNDELCREQGYDFAFDIPGIAPEVMCGFGPGTPCDPARPQYCDGHKMMECLHGKVIAADCQDVCRSGSGVASYDDGTCAEKDGRVSCACCDLGELGCVAKPIPRNRISFPTGG